MPSIIFSTLGHEWGIFSLPFLILFTLVLCAVRRNSLLLYLLYKYKMTIRLLNWANTYDLSKLGQ